MTEVPIRGAGPRRTGSSGCHLFLGRLYSGIDPSFDVEGIGQFGDHLVNVYTHLLCVPFGLYQALKVQGKTEEAKIVGRQFESRWRNANVELDRCRFWETVQAIQGGAVRPVSA